MMFHIHLTKQSEQMGVYIYDECRCGARRTRWTGRGYSARRPGWPEKGIGWRR